MGLTVCKDCGGDVSTNAAACPHCGAPVKPLAVQQASTNTSKKRTGVGTLIIALFIIGLAVYFAAGGDNDNAASPSTSDSSSAPSKPDAFDYAYTLCKMVKSSGYVTQCKVNITSDGNSVDATIDTNGPEAQKMCSGVVEMMAKQTHAFAGKWQFRIFSPYGQQGPIASCALE